jgi:hypothetical protein
MSIQICNLGKRTVAESQEFKIGKRIYININEETADRIWFLKSVGLFCIICIYPPLQIS